MGFNSLLPIAVGLPLIAILWCSQASCARVAAQPRVCLHEEQRRKADCQLLSAPQGTPPERHTH